MSRLSFGVKKLSNMEEQYEQRKTTPAKYINPFTQEVVTTNEYKRRETVEEFTEDHSNDAIERAVVNGMKDKERIKQILRGVKMYMMDKSFKEQKWQFSMCEREIRKCLQKFFSKLNKKFVNDIENKLNAYDCIKNHIIEYSGLQVAKSAADKESGLAFTVLEECKDIAAAANQNVVSNSEKLRTYLASLSAQIIVQNQKYFVTKQMEEEIAKEKKYLDSNGIKTLETTHRWCQIDPALSSSDITVEVHSARRLKVSEGASHVFVQVKVNDQRIGKTPALKNIDCPTWETAITLEMSRDLGLDTFTFEVYEKGSSVALIGECTVHIEEILDNTLFNNKFNVALPVIPSTKERNDLSRISVNMINKPADADELDANRYDEYLDNIFYEEEHCGILRLSFEVRLDSSFKYIVEKLREQRLENIQVISEQNSTDLRDHLAYLKKSIDAINTLEMDASLGVIGRTEELEDDIGEKKRSGVACGMEGCNMF